MANIYHPEYQDDERPEGFGSQRARIGYELGTELIGASLFTVPPGEAAYPYHYHYADEELLIVIAGRPSLRSPGGIRELEEGEAVRFELGEDGAHQIINRSEEPVSFLSISSSGRPDIVVYPDSGKISAAERLPKGGGLSGIFRLKDEADYFEGEQYP